MKKALLLGLFSISSALLLAQKPLSIEAEEIAQKLFITSELPKITGHLLHYEEELDKELEVFYYTTQFDSQFPVQKSAEIDPEGNFEIILPYAAPYQKLQIAVSDIYFGEPIIHQGLSISIDLEKYRGKRLLFPSLDGPDADLNQYLQKYTFASAISAATLLTTVHNTNSDRDLSFTEKIEKIKELYASLGTFNKGYIEKNPSPYAWILAEKLNSQMYQDLFSISLRNKIDEPLLKEILAYQPGILSRETIFYYQSINALLSSETQEEKFFRTEKVLNSLITGKPQKDSLQIYLTEYKKRRFKEPYDKEIYKSGAYKYLGPHKQELEQAKLNIHVQKLAKLPSQKANLVAFIGQPDDLWKRETYLRTVLPILTASTYKTRMEAQWEQDKEKVLKLDKVLTQESTQDTAHPYGTQVLHLEGETSLYVSDKTEVEDFLTTVQEVHKGKSIILDIWTTWCGPCLMDMKRSKPIKAKMKDLPVKVIYLCMEDGSGSNLESWKKKVADMGTEGEHILLPKDFAKKFMKHFEFNSYPSYVFIDKNGEIDLEIIQRISMINIEELKKRL